MGNLERSTTTATSSLMIRSGSVRLINLPINAREKIKEIFQLANPTYEQAIRANPRARYTLSPYIRYWREDKTTGDLILGRGAETLVCKLAHESGVQLQVTDNRTSNPLKEKLITSIKLRDYQVGVVEAVLTEPQGILRADTGAGKTILGIKLIEALQQKTLIIVPKLDLLNQWKNELKQSTSHKNIGVIQGKNCDIQDVTVATIQSLRNWRLRGGVETISFGSILVDECHTFVTDKRISELQEWPVQYFYGLTATDRRTDGQGDAINWIFGDKLVDIKVPRLAPKVQVVPFNGYIPVQEYADMIEDQASNEARNAEIISLIKQEVGRKVLVLTKRVAHYEQLHHLLDDANAIIFHSKQKKEERDTLLQNLRSGDQDFSCLFGTFSLLSTGIDIPSLDTLIIAGDLKSDVLAEQSAGRILRLFEGKTDCKIIDIWDIGNGILKNQGRLRQQFYKEQGWEFK